VTNSWQMSVPCIVNEYARIRRFSFILSRTPNPLRRHALPRGVSELLLMPLTTH